MGTDLLFFFFNISLKLGILRQFYVFRTVVTDNRIIKQLYFGAKINGCRSEPGDT